MPPNNHPTSPTSVVDLTPILTIGIRDWDIDVTIQMYETHLDTVIAAGEVPEYMRVIQARLYLIKHGHADPELTMIPDVNSGHYLTAEDWFIRYGFAPDMVFGDIDHEIIDDADRRLNDWLNETHVGFHPIDDDDDDLTVSTCSLTIGSIDTVETGPLWRITYD